MNSKITSKQATAIVVLFTIGTSMVNSPGRSARSDEWISIILSYILFIPISIIYSSILEKFPGKNIFQICEMVLGKLIGKIIIILFTWHAFISMALLLRNLGDFIYTVGPQETPMIVNMICLGILAILSIYFGINVLGRWCVIILPIIVFILLVPLLFLLPEMNIYNILPIMYEGTRPVINGVKETMAFPTTQNFIFFMLFESLEDIHKFKWVLIKGVFWGEIILFFTTISTILVEGGHNYYNAYLPFYVALRRLTIGEFFERLEITILLTFVYTIFVKISIVSIATMRGIGYIFNIKDYKVISTMIVFLAVNLGYIFYANTMEGIYFINNIWPTYALIFQVLLPFILFIIIELKLGRRLNVTKK